MNEQIWNESIFDGVTGSDLDALNRAFENGVLADFEPKPNDIDAMSEPEVVQHAHRTRDAFLVSIKIANAAIEDLFFNKRI